MQPPSSVDWEAGGATDEALTRFVEEKNIRRVDIAALR
jgi:hypothetical protein